MRIENLKITILGKHRRVCELAIKAHAIARKGRRIESHAELWKYKNEVAKELREWIKRVLGKPTLCIETSMKLGYRGRY